MRQKKNGKEGKEKRDEEKHPFIKAKTRMQDKAIIDNTRKVMLSSTTFQK